MKHILIAIVAAVLVVGCGESQSPEPPTTKAPDISPRTPDILPTSPIHDAAYKGNIEAVKEYLAAGGLLPHPWDVNAKNDRGSTPLHYAAKEGSKEVAKLLIAKSADVNAKNDFWSTPLHHAAWNGRTEIAEMLIAAGADVNAKDDKGRTPLDLATQRKKTETADILRKHGAKTGEELKAEGK